MARGISPDRVAIQSVTLHRVVLENCRISQGVCPDENVVKSIKDHRKVMGMCESRELLPGMRSSSIDLHKKVTKTC